MKSFLDHLKEEVLPSVQVADGGLDIDKPAVRAAINAAIAGVVSQPAVTPYVVFNRLSKLLAQYHIVLPKKFLEGDKGVEVFEIKQFGHRMGMTDNGEFVSEVPSTHYLFLQYGIITPFGVTYAKPVVGGMFRVMARLVDKGELDKLLDMAEITMSEEAEQMQAIAKANAPKEEMHTALGDCGCNQGRSPSTKKAIKVSMKKDLSEERKRTSSVADAFLKGQKANQRTLKSHGDSVTYHGNTIAKHVGDEVHVTTAGHALSPSTRGHVNGILSRLGSPKLSVRKGQLHHGDTPVEHDAWIKVKKSTVSEEKNDLKDACWKGYTAKGLKKKGGRMVPNCVPVEESEQYAPKKAGVKGSPESDRHELSVRNPGHDSEYHVIKTTHRGGKALNPPDVVVGKPNYISKKWKNLKEDINPGQVLQDLRDADAKKNPSGPAAYRKDVEDKSLEQAGKNYSNNMKEEQINEIGDTAKGRKALGRYIKKAHVSGLAAADDAANAYHRKDYKELRKHNRTGEKREQGVNRAADKLAKEETIVEKAPPGAKFKRMAKHIKAGYAEGGLTDVEKRKAFGATWKAYKREKGE